MNMNTKSGHSIFLWVIFFKDINQRLGIRYKGTKVLLSFTTSYSYKDIKYNLFLAST